MHAHTHTHKQSGTDTQVYSIYTIYTQLNRQQTGISGTGRQQGGAENVAGLLHGEKEMSRLDLKESREDFCRRGRRSVHVEGPKTEKAWEPTVESLVCGISYMTPNE